LPAVARLLRAYGPLGKAPSSLPIASLSVDGFVEKIDRKFLRVRGKKSLVTLRLYRQRFLEIA
jgi:hypothetical protein